MFKKKKKHEGQKKDFQQKKDTGKMLEKEENVAPEESWKEQLLRVSADFQNLKRRVEKEKLEWIKIAQVDVIKSFLSLVDDFDRAIESSERSSLSDEVKAWLEGFKMIRKNLSKKLSDLGVSEIDYGKEFDPHLHEALMQVSSKDHKSGEIVQVISPGYLFKDEVIRHAKVSVAK